MGITVEPATADRFDDVASILRPANDNPHACWCLYYRLGSSDFNKLRGPDRPAYLQQLCHGERAPGMVAYADGEPIGWCAIGPREDMGRLERSRTIPKIDDRPVWSIVCFVVKAGHRRKGVARALLAGAIDYARQCGVETLEAYPADTGGDRISSAFAYTGTTTMFEDAGFTRVQETASRTGKRPRWLLRLDLPRAAGS